MIRCVAVVIALAASALVLALAPNASAAGFRSCGTVPIGFTSAKITAQGMRCAAAREVFAAWRSVVRRAKPNGGPPPTRVAVGPFSCRIGGNDLTVKLNCNGADGTQRMRARWGG